MGLVAEAIEKTESTSVGSPAGFREPTASCNTIVPRRATTAAIPGERPDSTCSRISSRGKGNARRVEPDVLGRTRLQSVFPRNHSESIADLQLPCERLGHEERAELRIGDPPGHDFELTPSLSAERSSLHVVTLGLCDVGEYAPQSQHRGFSVLRLGK